MNNKKYIVELISRHITSRLSPVEQEHLDDWLSEPHNKLQFEKIVDLENIYANLGDLDYFHANNKQEQFNKYISSKISIRRIMAYVATLLLPVAVGIMILLMNKQEGLFNQQVAESWKVEPGNVILKIDNGEVHTFSHQDTLIETSLGKISVDSAKISFAEKAQQADSLIQYQTIVTPKGSQYQLQLADGSSVWLNAQTKFRYPTAFAGEKREVFLIDGEAYFQVCENKQMPFIVNVDHEQVKVLGTQFNIKAYNEENINRITLVEGSVLVSNEKNQAYLEPNQQIEIKSGSNDLILKNVNVNLYTAWKNRKFIYRNASLQQIMMDMERQYNLKIFYEDMEVQYETFSVSVDLSHDFTDILELMEATGSVHFEIKDKLLVIKK
jgi:hypothetical protein